MLHSFHLQNFIAFREESGINLDGDKRNKEDSTHFMESSYGSITAKTATILGANGSGKTSFLKGLSFLYWFMRDSWQDLAKDQAIPCERFALTPEKGIPSKFSLKTEYMGNIFSYDLTLRNNSVDEELFAVRRRGQKRTVKVFTHHLDDVVRYKTSAFSKKQASIATKLKNTSFISYMYHAGFTLFDSFLKSFNCVSCLDSNAGAFKPILANDLDIQSRVYASLKELDTGISELRFTQDANGEYQVEALHKINGKQYALPLSSESGGIFSLLSALTYIYSALKYGDILLYDQIERNLHPNVLPELLELFYSPEKNTRNAQLICTCHAPTILKYMHKAQVFFATKNEEQESRIYPLSTFKKLYKEDTLVSKYLIGRFGAIPKF